VAIVGALMLLAVPEQARADGFVSPFVGATFKGDATHTSPAVGIAGGWMGAGILGVEGDLGWSPEFFQKNGFLTERQLTTLVVNAIAGAPIGAAGSFKPYVSGGVGLLRPMLAEAGDLARVEGNKLAVDIGGGAMAFFNRSVGVRGDIRYFRGMRKSDLDDNAFGVDFSKFHFWRASIGLAVRF
jgi:hypothetical protein